MERNTKQQENLRREISSHLRDFQRNREWADFSNWLHRLQEILGSKKFPVLPQQITLCKRLAQCLNPSLPAGVHKTALKVYETILQNFSDKSELLSLTALGLLPFFQHSNIENKQTVLKIFDQHYVAHAEGIQMIVGLVNALLTVLNQNSEDLAKRVYAICEKVNRNFGKLWVDGAVWINILKSPKVRLAGFKYFTKVFRDRDRALQGEQQKQNQQNQKQKKIVQQIQKSIQTSKLRQQEKYLLTSIYSYKNRPDQPNLRFPNFSSLVLNALQVCLDSGDSMIKRAALDLLGTYLKLNSGVFAKREGVIIIQRMLILLQTKQFSLTNRVYKYLFDQPNSEGYFYIETQKKGFELQVLRQALSNLLLPKDINPNQNVFVIIEILLGDHPTLAQFLLQSLAHQIISFAAHLQSKQKKQQALIKIVNDFYLRVIFQYRKLFVPALLSHVPNLRPNEIDPLSHKFISTLETLQFYFSRMEKSVVSFRKKSDNLEEVEQKRIDQTKQNIQYLSIRVQTLQKLIEYLYNFRPYEQSQSLSILDLCNDLLVEIQIVCDSKEEGISTLQVEKILVLLNQEAQLNRKDIYAKLLTLLPKPKKQLLLPYIQDNALSIVCINLILGGDKPTKEHLNRHRNLPTNKTYRSINSRSGSVLNMSEPISLEQQQQKKVFFAIFKLLNCHLFQARALEFIQRFKTWWGEIFSELIDQVEPSQWLIYWKRLDGNVAGGIVRMIQNLQCLNSYHQHLSRKWIKDSQSIISKVLEAIYGLLEVKNKMLGSVQEEQVVKFREWNINEYKKIYSLLKLVFRFTSKSFIKFFYLQKDKYLAPFILYIFKCLQNESFGVKSESISMLTFILTQAQLAQEKITFLNLTLANILSILDSTITQKKQISQKIELANASQVQGELHQSRKGQALREELVLWDNLQIELLQYILLCIKRISQIGSNQTKMQQQAVVCLKECNLYDIIIKGIVFTQTYYIKRFYLEISKDLTCLLSQIDRTKAQVSFFIDHILSKLHILLKNSDLSKLQQIIKNRNEPSTNDSNIKKKQQQQQALTDVYLSFSKESLGQHQIKQNLNLQEKYSETIELWNTVKFYLTEAVKLQIKKLPTISLLSLVLKTFPLSFLKYTPVGSEQHTTNLQNLEEQLSNATGLKKQVFEIFQIIWNKESNQILDFLIQKSDPRILIHSQLQPSKVLLTFLKMSKIIQLTKYLKADRFSLPKNMLHYNLSLLLKQNQLMFFIYMYLLYCNLRLLRSSNKVRVFLESLIEIFQIFKASPHIQTKLWLLELIDLVGQRMLSSKEIVIEGGIRVREKLQQLTKQIIDEMQAVISKSKIFTHRHELKTGLFSLFTKQQKQISYYDFVKIFPPTIQQHYQRYIEVSKKSQEIIMNKPHQRKNSAQQPRQRVSQYLLQQQKMNLNKQNKIDQFLFGKFINRTQQEYIEYLSLCALRTLIRIGNNVLILIFDRDTSKINTIIREILNDILPISQIKHQNNMLINQLIAQYLQTLLQHESLRADIIKNSRRQIIEIYMKDDFFKCTQQTLAYWRTIVDHCTDNNDLLGQLLSRQGFLEGIFTRKAQGIRLKIKSFERVCFVIWSGKPDKYENKLRKVLQSLNEVMKQQQAAPALLILILFCIRILIMRLSAICLNKLFRSVWPSLITLLIQIFKKDSKHQKNPNLLLAGLKVLQLLHALQLQDFILHRWIFLFDYFGIKLDPIGQIEDNLTNCDILSPFVFKPLVTNCLPNNRLRCKFLPQKSESQIHTNRILRRRLIVKKSFVESEQQVKQMGLLLMQYMMDLNECRTQIKKQDIESVIEEDFISLDDYIFKIR